VSEQGAAGSAQPGDEEAIAILTRMVDIPSVSGQEQRLARFLSDTMSGLGFEAEIDGAGNAVGHLGRGDTQIVLLGHMDTVPGHVPVKREGNLLYGRGSVDAKGALAAFVVAAARVGPLPGVRLAVIGVVEEEAATSRGARYVAGRYRPDYAVIGEPSGWNRITLGYKGRLLIDYSLQRPVAHTAGQRRGVCEDAVAYWLRVTAWAKDYNRGITSRRCTARFATLDPSLRSIRSASDGLQEQVEMTIGLRLPPGLEVEALIREITETWPDDARVTTRGYERAFRAGKRNPLTSAFLSAIRAEAGKAAFVTKTGTSDMNVLGPRWGCPMVAYGPGDSNLDHAPNEHLDLDEYLRSIRVLVRVLRRLLQTHADWHARPKAMSGDLG